MTINNLGEQLPWLLRNLQATHPARASAPATSAASLGPPAALFASSLRNDVLGGSSAMTSTPTHIPDFGLPTPVSTASSHGSKKPLKQQSERRTENMADRKPPARVSDVPLPPEAFMVPTSASLPRQSKISTPAKSKSRRLSNASSSVAAKGPSIHMTPSASTQMRKVKTPIAPSPYAIDFGSDIDMEDFESVVDLTGDENAGSSSPGRPPREDVRLWREDYALRPEPLGKRGKKRKSGDISANVITSASSLQRAAPSGHGHVQKMDGGEDGDVEEFPDINDLVAMPLSSPTTLRRSSPNSSRKRAAKKPAEDLEMEPLRPPDKREATPKRRRQSGHSEVVLDSEDEFVTPSTRNASFVTCPAEITICDDSIVQSPPRLPSLREASHVAATPLRKSAAATAATAATAVAVAENLGSTADGKDLKASAHQETAMTTDMAAAKSPSKAVAVDVTVPAAGPASDQAAVDMDMQNPDDEDAQATQRPGILAYWPALRWKQHTVEEKIRQNTMEYMKALREKWPHARRMAIKGDKEPLLKQKQPLDSLMDDVKAYASLYSEQEALLHSITEAYQNHQDTESEEARLDKLSQELQDQEDALRSRLSEAQIDPKACPADFDAGSPSSVVIPATQHPVHSFDSQMFSHNSAMSVAPSESQIVLQTQLPAWAPSRAPGPGAFNSQLDYFEDDDIFTEIENLPPISGAGGAGSAAFSSRLEKPQSNALPRRTPSKKLPPATGGPDLFSDFSDDIEMLQAAEDFEQQRSFSADTTTTRQGPSRSALGPTSGNASRTPAKNPSKGPSTAASTKRTLQQPAKKIPQELMSFEWSQDVRRALKDRFRMSGFRHNQLEAINATLSGKDAFVLMPTGGGKSLCYQLPAVINSGKTSGVSIVISPLLSLMQDQVDHLKALNIAASAFNSGTPAPARKHILALFSKPNPDHFLQLLYVTPEMVSKSQQFCQGLEMLYRKKKLARIVIDEAHCVSQWGHDFRPDYKALGEVRRRFPSVPVMALTATATPNVIVDIKHNLSIAGCKVFSQSFNRPNLYYEVRDKGKGIVDSIAELIVSQYSGETGIVYTLSQKSTVSIAEKLRDKFGISAHHYHAGIDAAEKTQIQRDWQQGKIKVVVATIAFGMGIDKPDVRFVIHHYLPKSLEGYYQETGRAGRDGKHSDCYLFFSYGDIKNLRKFIADSDGSEAQKERQRAMLNRMVDFCENKRDCRRTEILRYFGETFDATGCDGTCDNCKNGGQFDLVNFTQYAVAALQVVREYELITMLQCSDILQGKKRPDAQHSELLEVYGIAKHIKRNELHMMIYSLLGKGALCEENKVNRMDIAIQYFSLGRRADDFFSGKEQLHVVTKVGSDAGSTVTERMAKKTKSAGTSADTSSTDKASKKKAMAKTKTTSKSSTSSSKKRKGATAASFIDDEAEEDGDDVQDGGDSEFENFQGPVHANGYAKDNFVVSDNDDDYADDFDNDFDAPPRPSKSTSNSSSSRRPAPVAQRQRRLEELGGPIARDPRLAEANVDPIHADIIAAFVDEARRVEERIRNEKGLRILFTESHLREMAINWTDTLDKMKTVRGIDESNVKRYGAKFIPLVKRYLSTYQDMMGFNSDSASGSNGASVVTSASSRRARPDYEAVVDLISSDEEDGEGDDMIELDGYGEGHGTTSAYFGDNGGRLSVAESREAKQWRMELETLQTQPSNNKNGGGASQKNWVPNRRGSRRGGGRSGGGRSGGGGGGVSGRKASSSTAKARGARGGNSRGGGAGARGGGSGIGMMPL